MGIILVSVIFSVATTIVITAIVRKEVKDYVDKICEMNVEQAEKIKECAITNIEKLVCKINQKGK